jgi:hypothetical protein
MVRLALPTSKGTNKATPGSKGRPTVDLSNTKLRKINICLQTLEVGANDKSAQELENALKN